MLDLYSVHATPTAFCYQPYVALLSLLPTVQAQTHLALFSDRSSQHEHRIHLQEYFATITATYAIRAQFASSLSMNSVEDASVVWPEASAPVLDLGTFESPPVADSYYSAEKRARCWEDRTALSPWNGLEEHRLLGESIG